MTETIFELSINLIETLIFTDFITKYLGSKYNNCKKIIGFVLCWLTAFLQICFMNKITTLETVGAYIHIGIYFLYAVCFLKGSVWLKLWLSFLTYLMIYIIALTTNLIICYIIEYNPNDMITVFNSTRVIGVIITKIISFYATRLILRKKCKNPVDGHTGWLLICIPSISLISLGALMKVSMYNPDLKMYILIGMASIVSANIMTYYFFVVINKEYENTIKTKLLEQQNENLKSNIAGNEAFVNEMKTVRHDMKHQLLTIQSLAEDGKNGQLQEYINSLTNTYLPNVLKYITTDNDVFDAVVNTKIAVCNQKQVFMDVNVKQGTMLKLPHDEIAILFGNLLDNAIEATENTAEKRITVDIQMSGNYLMILVGNSIEASVLKDNAALETSKENKELHGIGVKSIKNIVKRHNGMLQYYEEENRFFCHIMLENNPD